MTAKGKQSGFFHALSGERLSEFRDMSAKKKLQWLEEANDFVNKALGLKKRARFERVCRSSTRRALR